MSRFCFSNAGPCAYPLILYSRNMCVSNEESIVADCNDRSTPFQLNMCDNAQARSDGDIRTINASLFGASTSNGFKSFGRQCDSTNLSTISIDPNVWTKRAVASTNRPRPSTAEPPNS